MSQTQPGAFERTPIKSAINPHPTPSPMKREGLPNRGIAPLPSLWGKGPGDGGKRYRIISCTFNSAGR